MHKYITKTVLYSSVLLLSACGSLITGSSQSPATVTTAGDTDIQALIKKAEALPSFEYIHNNTQYIAYLNGQPELIKVTNGTENKLFFYKGSKVSVIQNNQEVYHINGQNNQQQDLVVEAAKLQKMFGPNSADKGASNVKTGGDAKLNYLCITKIQQVAQTKRVFRSSANAANSNSRLTADVRLNGNQFYKMDCQLSGERVAKLSLIKK